LQVAVCDVQPVQRTVSLIAAATDLSHE
jgi:hypothetical protein